MKPSPTILAATLVLLACGTDTTAPTPPATPDPPTVPAAATAWLNAEAIPFSGSHLSLPLEELAFLDDIVGSASIVSLGENTHGTRDFFEMKARILRYLVEELGFDGFAIEATWPEANRLNRYVRDGVGDPARLLAGLYFWTWNTESVLEMIEWMRDYNQAGGDLGFYGFDMQYPGMAIQNFLEYVDAVDPALRGEFTDRTACLSTFANDPQGSFPSPGYADQTDAYRAECGASLTEALSRFLAEQSSFEAASSPQEFAFALQSLRVATQYHLTATREGTRDQFMAENTVWIHDQMGAGSKLVLWAHNFHVSTLSGAQGWFLRPVYGDDMVIVGFTHDQGEFTAVEQRGANFFGIASLPLGATRPLSYEHHLASADAPRFVLDLRNRDPSNAGSAWLAGPRAFRSIGCCYDPSNTSRYWTDASLPQWFDVVIHFDQTGPTTVLPFNPPSQF